MLIKEFRIVMPMTVDEYQVAQLFSVAQASKNETGGGEGIEVIKNEPFSRTDSVQPPTPLLGGEYTSGQYTYKIYHLESKMPKWLFAITKMFGLKGALNVEETAWNAYPYCRTIVSNPDYMKDNFFIKIESMHVADRGNSENVHRLNAEDLAKREVVHVDIANDCESRDYKESEDPKKFKSSKTNRGPLVDKDWRNKADPVMCCYKLVTVHFKWFGLQNRVESYILKAERRIFTNFHRQVFCWTDGWYGLTMKDIRELEEKTKRELDEQITQGSVRGTTDQ